MPAARTQTSRKPRGARNESQADPTDRETTPQQTADNATPARTPRSAKTPREKKEKKMSQLDAAAKILTGRTKPMTCQQLVELMAERKLWESPHGKTPERTLSASLDRDIADKGSDSRFQKVGPGLYLLYGVKYTPAAE